MRSNLIQHFIGHRGQRDLPSWSRWAPAPLLLSAAKYRRAAGWYDTRTLALFRRIWVRRRCQSAFLDYVTYRRDLGHSLAQCHGILLMELLGKFPSWRRRTALDLLAEAGFSKADAHSSEQANVRAMQSVWRVEFTDWLLQQGDNGICVVGNGGNLLGAGLGPVIDSHGAIVRFNQYHGNESTLNDVGQRTDILVISPDFNGFVPTGIQWLVISGPDMAFKMQKWHRFSRLLHTGVKVLTVPLQPWHELVSEIQAPPSAGLLFLCWIRSLLSSWSRMQAVGFGFTRNPRVQYHHANPKHASSKRHNWPAELVILNRWKKEGLRIELSA